MRIQHSVNGTKKKFSSISRVYATQARRTDTAWNICIRRVGIMQRNYTVYLPAAAVRRSEIKIKYLRAHLC